MNQLLSLDTLWNHWEGHRRLTLRTLEAFPQDQLLQHPVENMRSFAELMSEIVNVEESIMHGLEGGQWKWEPSHENLGSKAELLKAFEQVRGASKAIFAGLSLQKLQMVETDAWGGDILQPRAGFLHD